MSRLAYGSALAILGILVGLAVGYLLWSPAGSEPASPNPSTATPEEDVEFEVAGALSRNVEIAGILRLAEPSREVEAAIQALEGSIDSAIYSLPQGRSYREMAPAAQTALAKAKVYRTLFPSTRQSDLELALRDVPEARSQAAIEASRVLTKLSASSS